MLVPERLRLPQQALAREFSASEIRQGQRPNGSTDPRNIAEYAELVETNFSGYRLNIPRMFAALLLLSIAGIVIFALLSVLTHLALRRWHESAIARES